jgi:mRNA-degrading endonuclease RelE of RelBE toxin-antitoxin system
MTYELGFLDEALKEWRALGYRLVYKVHDRQLIVVVVAVGKRERNAVYIAADKRSGGRLFRSSTATPSSAQAPPA